MLECLRYESALTCRIFEIIPLVLGSILFILSSVQMCRELILERNHHVVGKITKDIHRAVFICSPTYMIGWLLNTMMDNSPKLLFADICIDSFTISLAYILWIIAHEKVGLWYYELTRTIPTWPRRMIDILLFISICWVVVNNSVNYKIDRLWPRSFFLLLSVRYICYWRHFAHRIGTHLGHSHSKFTKSIALGYCYFGFYRWIHC